MSGLNVVDSSGWLEYFNADPRGDVFAPAIEAVAFLIIPAITIYEVYRRLRPQRSDFHALQAVSVMRLGLVIDFDVELALAAARLSLDHKLAMADSMILATARRTGATLWTQDADFDGIAGVRYFPKVVTSR